MNNPFDFFEKIYCINLDHRTDRWEKCNKKFKELGISEKVQRFSAFNFQHPDPKYKKLLGQAGCTLSHFSVLKNSIDNNISNYLVLEDDFEIELSKEELFIKLNNSLKELPENWDLLYLGGNLTNEYGKFPIQKYSNNLFLTHSCHTTHAIAFNRNLMLKLANEIGSINDIIKWILNNGTIDVFLSKKILEYNNCFITNPNLIYQEDSFSDIETCNMSYKNLMKSSYNFFNNQIEKSDLVTVVFTSCGRFDLLEKTVNSFIKYNTYPIEKYIIIDNSCSENSLQKISKIFNGLNYEAIINTENIGQISSIDKAYSFVKTEYIFHCEDDWEFFDYGFIQKSLDVLKFDINIINVNLRVRFDGEKGSMHPVSNILKTKTNNHYHTYIPNYLGIWHGFSWNPGLRRLSDYEKIKPYKKYKDESGVGQVYFLDGKISACLHNYYCKHIGAHSKTEKSNQ